MAEREIKVVIGAEDQYSAELNKFNAQMSSAGMAAEKAATTAERSWTESLKSFKRDIFGTIAAIYAFKKAWDYAFAAAKVSSNSAVLELMNSLNRALETTKILIGQVVIAFAGNLAAALMMASAGFAQFLSTATNLAAKFLSIMEFISFGETINAKLRSASASLMDFSKVQSEIASEAATMAEKLNQGANAAVSLSAALTSVDIEANIFTRGMAKIQAEEDKFWEDRNRKLDRMRDEWIDNQAAASAIYERFMAEQDIKEAQIFEERDKKIFAARSEWQTRAAVDMIENEKKVQDEIMGLKFAAANQAVALMHIVGQKSKALALAALVFQKGLAMAQVWIQTQTAASAALAPPPLGLGPVFGVPLAASIQLWGKVQMALIAATGIAEAAMGGGGSSGIGGPSGVGGGGGVGAMPIAPLQETKPSQNITVIIQNGMGDADYWKKITEENIVPAINDASERNVNLVVKYA